MNTLSKFFSLLASLVFVTLSVHSQHRVGLRQIDGSITYDYPISSQTIDGAALDVRLTYNSNVSQNLFTGHSDPYTIVDGIESWSTVARVAGLWLLSVNGLALVITVCPGP